ncbi:aspartyl-tRNA(Asn)/glutamyl-tRNA(Gln) amidotransferase subunit A [Salinihabitans flavidus]|uniref:Aspartyl-tRNA(Asn)/glutamyl-tRNA(Gln) amidotransferase subunit A n=1 Tax=Salinihabitans flavidus TaxID=569882 RepID=A0A1H8MV60_9RHOB|nr:amidase family protein [Salinihabitans flavidus]SEO21341.1 aspartyl-tRNA(Asn)/glutamyl-tRNA(Gln) amidotransferase subunit A [Salinihabitans flavidus]
MFEWLEMSAADLGRGIGEGAIDPVALTQAFLGAIESHDLRDRIYARLTPDRAMAEAAAAAERARAGYRLSPLDGVPVSWKDLFDTAGVETEAGSALLRDRVPGRDARVLRNATAMGLVCLGKTHMSELAFSGLGYNPITATPPCVNDPRAVSGGSSSGAAASVAFGLAAAGVGTDTGGSVRIPSAWNDLVGLKTTEKRLSLEGVVPLCPSFDTVGPLCRTVEDAALMLAALEGRGAPDLRGARLEGMRFALLDTVAMDDLEDTPHAAFLSAVERLQAAGARVERVEAPEVARAMALSGVLFTGEAYGQWRDEIEADPDLMFDRIRERFQSGASFSAPDFAAGWAELHEDRRRFDARMARFDAVLTPACPILPPDLARLGRDESYYVSRNLLTLRNTRIGNLMGQTVLTLPTGVASCGIQFATAPMSEDRLLRIGAAAEAVLA